MHNISPHKPQFEDLPNGLVVRAPAKLNLSLLVAGKRPDGYHELETIMAKVSLYDELQIELTDDNEIQVFCRGKYPAPNGAENLAYKAAEMFLLSVGQKRGVQITIDKNIPAGAGLAGGSSDAAAVLLALNRCLKTNLPDAELVRIAGQLGSDVAFFLAGPLAFCTGRGEIVEQISKKFDFKAVLAIPAISVATKKVYENYRHNTSKYRLISGQINAFLQKNRLDLITKMCANMLEQSSFAVCPDLAEFKVRLEKTSLFPWCMTGSGSVMYCVVSVADSQLPTETQLAAIESCGCVCEIVYSNHW